MNGVIKFNFATVLAGILRLTANASQLPFLETFEVADGIGSGTIDGQNGWVLDGGTGEVQSCVGHTGSQSLEIKGGRVTHDLSSDGSSLWLHFQARCEEVPSANPVVTDANTSLSFFVNTNLNLVVYSNTVPVELSAQMQTNIWMRFDIYCDYDDQYWDLSMDGINIVAGLPLYSSNTQVGSLIIGNEDSSSVYIDQIDIADTEQTEGGLPDSDGDEIPDWWEQKYSGGVTNVVAGSVSGNNGLTYLQTYIAGVNPSTSDPFTISIVSGANGIRWSPTVPSRLYSVYWSTNLVDGFSLLQGDIPYPQSEYIDSAHAEEISGFYRLNAQVR